MHRSPETATLGALLARHVAATPHAPAILGLDAPVTFAQFDERVTRTQAWLAQQGVGRGDVVAVWLVNRVEWLAMFFALARLGATLAAVNTRYRAHELEHIVRRSQARMLVMQTRFRQIDFGAVLQAADPAALASLQAIAWLDAPAEPVVLPGVRALSFAPTPAGDALADQGQPDDAVIFFTTSGTTSQPKLVVHTQATMTAHATHTGPASGLQAADAVLLAALPFCGTFGLTGALAALACGRPIVMQAAFEPQEACTLMAHHGVTHLFGSDEMARRILALAPGERPFPALRLFGFASFQPGSDELAAQAWKRGIPMAGLYGSSEVHALFATQRADLPLAERVRGGGVPAHPQARVRVRDVESGQLAATGRTGMLEIRAPTNFTGYLGDAPATAAAIDAEGFFRTGDVGHLRTDGSFVYEARLGDAMRLGGFLVNPSEIEELLEAQPGVQAAQVVAVPIAGQPRAVAFVVPRADHDLDASALTRALGTTLATFKVPVRIWAIDALPVTESANGTKIQRARLREMALARLADEPPPSSDRSHAS